MMYFSHSFCKIKRFFAAAVAVILALTVAVCASGCSQIMRALSAPTRSIVFTQSSVLLEKGETFAVTEIIDSDFSSYDLSSSDDSIAAVSARDGIVTAIGAGTAFVTAENGSASARLRVVVTEKQPDRLSVSADGSTVQSDDGMSSVFFDATATGKCAEQKIYWLVNDSPVGLLDPHDRFEFAPTEAGVYTVTAECAGLRSEPVTVRVLAAVEASVGCSGALEQHYPFDDITFNVAADGDTFSQWYEDGALLFEGYEIEYTYSPSVGRHSLTVAVNGKTVFDEPAVFYGAAVPDVGEIEFDNMYPHAYLKYDAVGKAQVEIVSPTGEVNTYSQNNSEYADLFTEQGFDVSGVVRLCASDSARRAYRYRVKSLGDGDAVTESEYSPYATFMQLPSRAEKFVSAALPCGDLYVTSDAEYVDVMQYYIVFREKQADAHVSFDCYIAYDMQVSPRGLWNEAFYIAATSGLYSDIKITDLGGGVLRSECNVNTTNAPVRNSSGDRAEQLHAIVPHINYDAEKYRADDHVFAIDRREQATAVEYTDELYLTAQGATKPLPKAGSSAEAVYNMARAVLRKICSDDMTDMQKAHAVYDWIMWTVTYDSPVTGSSDAETFSSYYLEGVFGDGVTDMNGVKYDPHAVCDGISKAFSLMCNIEGLPCMRVVGVAGHGAASDAGGHAWNKVFVNGAWYLVDCTWGDTQGRVFTGDNTKYEYGLHRYLFLTDAQIDATHHEPFEYTKTSIVYAPETTDVQYNIYEHMPVGDEIINCVVSRHADDAIARIWEITDAAVAAIGDIPASVSVPFGFGMREYPIDYMGFEIYFEDKIRPNDHAVLVHIENRIKRVMPSAKVQVVLSGNLALVLYK